MVQLLKSIRIVWWGPNVSTRHLAGPQKEKNYFFPTKTVTFIYLFIFKGQSSKRNPKGLISID